MRRAAWSAWAQSPDATNAPEQAMLHVGDRPRVVPALLQRRVDVRNSHVHACEGAVSSGLS